MAVRERDVEGYLKDRLARLGLDFVKFVPDYKNGMPDRLILLPEQRVCWVEMKTVGGELSPLQKLRQQELKKAGHRVEVVWTKQQADELCLLLRRELNIG